MSRSVMATRDSWTRRGVRSNGGSRSTGSIVQPDALSLQLETMRRMAGIDSPATWLRSLPGNQWQALLARLSPTDSERLAYTWEFWARPEQLPPTGDWRFWLLNGGR